MGYVITNAGHHAHNHQDNYQSHLDVVYFPLDLTYFMMDLSELMEFYPWFFKILVS